MSSQEAGTIYLLHYDTLRMFRTALITMWELEFNIDGDFMSNLTDMMRCIHIPVKRLEILVSILLYFFQNIEHINISSSQVVRGRS